MRDIQRDLAWVQKRSETLQGEGWDETQSQAIAFYEFHKKEEREQNHRKTAPMTIQQGDRVIELLEDISRNLPSPLRMGIMQRVERDALSRSLNGE